MHRHHFDPLQIDQIQNMINPKNTFDRFVILQTLMDIIHTARIQRNLTHKQKVTVFEIIFLKIHTFSPCHALLRLG